MLKVRTFIYIRFVPIFIGLAVANAAVLYFAKSRELIAGLEQQARAASVSTAEFLNARPALAARLASQPGRSALTFAMAQIQGLEAIYIVAPGKACCVFEAGRRPEPSVRAIGSDGPLPGTVEQRATLDHFITAQVRLDNGQTLAVEVDADRMLRAQTGLWWQAVEIVGAGALAECCSPRLSAAG